MYPPAQLLNEIKILRESHSEDEDSPSINFRRKAFELDGYKIDRLNTLRSMSKEGPIGRDVAVLITEVNRINGIPRHTSNLNLLIDMVFGNPELCGRVTALADPDQQNDLEYNVRAAAPWLALSHIEIPTEVMSRRKTPTSSEYEQYIDTAASRSAQLFEELKLGEKSVAAVIRDYRPLPNDPSERSAAGRILGLLETLAILAADPEYRANLDDLEDIFHEEVIFTDFERRFAAVIQNGIEQKFIDLAALKVNDERLCI